MSCFLERRKRNEEESTSTRCLLSLDVSFGAVLTEATAWKRRMERIECKQQKKRESVRKKKSSKNEKTRLFAKKKKLRGNLGIGCALPKFGQGTPDT